MKKKGDKTKQKSKPKQNEGSFFSNMKLTDEQIYEIKSSLTKKNIAIFLIGFSLLLMIFFQYQYEKKMHSGFDLNNEEDYYETLGLDQGADLLTVRKQYKKLAKLWHPDKHPNCKVCKEKFNKITTAHEELVRQLSSGHDRNSIFTSKPIVLTSKNYHKLVESSNDFWLIFVYEPNRGSRFLEHVASIYDDIANQYNSIIKFGVVDVIKQESLLTYLPFKFPILPSIYTHLSGRENELYQEIDGITVNGLMKFIEETYVSTVTLIDDKKMEKFYNEKGQIKSLSNKSLAANIDAKFFILSSKNYINLVARDFNRRYINECQMFQNGVGLYNDGLKIFNSRNDQKVFVSYNDINEKDDKTLTTVFQPIPVTISMKEDQSRKLQIAFELGKKLMMPQIYKNNFLKHCESKLELKIRLNKDNEIEFDELKESYSSESYSRNIDVCVIELVEKEKDYDVDKMNKILYKLLVNNFKSFQKEKSKKNEEYDISVNYGYADLKKNKNLFKLYKDFLGKKEANEENAKMNGKKFLIINLTGEKFAFKGFEDADKLENYFKNLNDLDFFEDISFSFEYFNEYEIKDISSLFNEEKIFSIKQTILSAIYAQTQPSYVALFIIIFISGIYVLKYDSTKSFVSFFFLFFSGSQSMLLVLVW